ncbi:pyridoxamine 5'-phosphate oxidase family protein [Streptomyces sp. BHT-5-2]|uniref:pyridoxamine 5'-phosphate oxidase family protein n=1 Tax=unclassified Streptomyces TaxID=2593676 RepID=UPI001C8D1E63|nr:pyridoxamine 5'-phosphate oxidase family protein [Streptomyces sp. BHT-5-2]QZL04612.1 pyridoxamine 5'-phosphate oxidase family protein [Streptomyces sp. BHT-5-2]
MTTPPTAARRMVDISGEEALYLLAGASLGRLVYEQRDVIAVRPAVHVLEYGRLIVRTPVPAATLAARVTVTYHADQINPTTGTGWAVSASGLAEVVTDPGETGHYRRTLSGWVHGPHDTLLRIHPQTVNGYRFAHAAGPAKAPPGAGRPSSR